MSQQRQTRTYDAHSSVVFLKTGELFGELSNMAPEFPLMVNGIAIRTSEALYQVCRFPYRSDIQRMIIKERSPMTAKMRSKPFRKYTRMDWESVRVNVMRWCLRVKLAQNWDNFGDVLLSTGDRPIVEKKIRRKDFWGATEMTDGSLVGSNVLGRLLMELREQLKLGSSQKLNIVEPPLIPDFLLYGQPIGVVTIDRVHHSSCADNNHGLKSHVQPSPVNSVQPSLWGGGENADELVIAAGYGSSLMNGGYKLKPYPEYKDSGVPWLGKVPTHWEIRPLKRLSRNVVEVTVEKLPSELYVALEHIESKTGFLQKNRNSHFAGQVKKFGPNDVLFGKLRPYLAKVALPREPGVCVSEILAIRPRPDMLDSSFVSKIILSGQFIDTVNSSTYGAKMPRAEWSFIGSLGFPLLPKPEQVQITRFLDCKTAQINKFIRNKRRLIELLKEQKRNIINQAVTQGLDPSVKLKPSGVEWLGDIPEHWDVRRLKFLCKNVNEQTSERKSSETYIALEHVESWTGLVSLPKGKIEFDSQVKQFRPDDVLFGKLRPYLAKVTRPQVAGVCVGEFLVLRAAIEMFPGFLEWKLRSKCVIDLVNSSTFGAKMPRADWTFIGNIKFSYPPEKEQQKIVGYIKEKSAEIDQTIARAEREIELMGEYRTRLVSDVVTGQVDVRGIDVPDVAEEPLLPLDEDIVDDDGLSDGKGQQYD